MKLINIQNLSSIDSWDLKRTAILGMEQQGIRWNRGKSHPLSSLNIPAITLLQLA
jgi:hypothetical protein